MDTGATSVAAGCGSRSPPEGGSECGLVAILPKQAEVARAKWLELFFKQFRGTKATVLGKDCCEIVKFLALNPQSFASMSELLEEAEDEEDEDLDESYKIAVSTEVDTVLANLAAELTRDGGCPATVSFDIAILNEIREQMNTCSEDDSKDEDDKKRWGEYAEWCKGLLDVRLKEKENEMRKTSKTVVMKERLLQLAEKKELRSKQRQVHLRSKSSVKVTSW